MSSVNKAILIGNCGQDPELRTFSNGGKIATIRLATSEKWKDKNTGEQKERTEWHTVVVGGEGLVKVVDLYVRKGTKLYIEGSLQTRKWQDQQGNDRYSTEVKVGGPHSQLVLLGGGERGKTERQARKKEDETRASRRGWDSDDDTSSYGGGQREGAKRPTSWADDDLDDDVPF